MNDSDQSVVILRFLRKANGELRCRIVDIATRESWVIEPASDLWKIIFAVRRTQ